MKKWHWSLSMLVIGLTPCGVRAQQSVIATIDASKRGLRLPSTAMAASWSPPPRRYGRKCCRIANSRIRSLRGSSCSTRQSIRRWPEKFLAPIGGDAAVTMDQKTPYVGDQTPVVKTAGTTPAGVSQGGLVLRNGKSYTGRVVLAGDPGSHVVVSLVWGPNPGDRQTVSVAQITRNYVKTPLSFTAKADTEDGRLEITGTGSGTFHIGPSR